MAKGARPRPFNFQPELTLFAVGSVPVYLSTPPMDFTLPAGTRFPVPLPSWLVDAAYYRPGGVFLATFGYRTVSTDANGFGLQLTPGQIKMGNNATRDNVFADLFPVSAFDDAALAAKPNVGPISFFGDQPLNPLVSLDGNPFEVEILVAATGIPGYANVGILLVSACAFVL